ncbi:hypothetical protein H5410_052560 [Solanum commersonii]|uniref:Uncharacterized protein n=1 Tax=Solanum commersonii TaxID=4109 RepID=A0A9J5X3D8_SOLCO|nr:hypothetical protein H5410_052560 [Solanum commersonii]
MSIEDPSTQASSNFDLIDFKNLESILVNVNTNKFVINIISQYLKRNMSESPLKKEDDEEEADAAESFSSDKLRYFWTITTHRRPSAIRGRIWPELFGRFPSASMKLRRKGKACQAVCPWVQDSSKKRGLTRRLGTLAAGRASLVPNSFELPVGNLELASSCLADKDLPQ